MQCMSFKVKYLICQFRCIRLSDLSKHQVSRRVADSFTMLKKLLKMHFFTILAFSTC